MPMGDELKWFLKQGRGRIVKSCDTSLENTSTSPHTVSLALVVLVSCTAGYNLRKIHLVTLGSIHGPAEWPREAT